MLHVQRSCHDRLKGCHTFSHEILARLETRIASDWQALEDRERDEVEWGEVVRAGHSGLVATRRLLWDESERKIIALLSSSSAFEGDHFLQVLCTANSNVSQTAVLPQLPGSPALACESSAFGCKFIAPAILFISLGVIT